MKKAKTPPPPRCDHGVTIGSYPGEGYASCDLPPGHDGDHEGTYSWAQEWPGCDGCPAPE